jgi:phosphatidylglycerophosphate synthase
MFSHLSHILDSPQIQIGKESIKKVQSTLELYIKTWQFLDSLHKSKVTPNGLVTFRMFLMVSWVTTYLLQKDIGATMMTISCILDATDGKLARNYDMKSKEGELYDPLSDKVTEVLLSVSSLVNLNMAQLTTQFVLMLPKFWLHYKSQFNEKRGSVHEQLEIVKKLILEWDKNIQYLKNTTDWAANTAWKWKTALQFTSGLGLIWLHTFFAQTLLDYLLKTWVSVSIEEVNDFLNRIFLWIGLSSIPFAIKSIYWRKDTNKTEILDEKTLQTTNDSEIQKNPYFLPVLWVSSVWIFYIASEILERIKHIIP